MQFLEERASYLVAVPEEPRPFRRQGMGYVFEPVDDLGRPLGLRFEVDLVKRRTTGMTAEMVVESTLPGVATRLFGPDIVNLQTGGKKNLARDLAELSGLAEERVPWRKLVYEFAYSVVEAEKEGGPFEHVSAAEPVLEHEYRAAHLLPEAEPTLLYGPWAVGKGHLATQLALCVASGLPFVGLHVTAGQVLYCDWEDTKKNFDERVWLHSRGLGLDSPPLDIHYRKMRGAFSGQLNPIARFVAEHGISLLVLDSVGLAAGMAGERGSYEDNALALFEALQYLPVTALLIDHVSEEGRQNTKTVGKAYGSIYKMALCRNAWEVRKDQALGAGQLSIGMYHTKANHGPLLHPLGIGIDFTTAGQVTVQREDVRDSQELSGRLPAHERIALVLRRGALPVKEIAVGVDLKENAVRTYLDRHERLFVKLPDGRWANRVPANGQMYPVESDAAEQIPF
jgi:DNA-directed RNA polymerase specialized sigma24 family protein